MYQAKYAQKLPDGRVQCLLCPHNCVIGEGKTGLCQTRVVKDGELWSRNYVVISGMSMDPIEKKPLFHFYPGHSILSVGTLGCNMRCYFCQNFNISQAYREGYKNMTTRVEPEELSRVASQQSSIGVAYTYSEPTVWYEYVLDTARLVHEAGLKNVLVTNGLINTVPLKELIPYIDAVNVDLKAFNSEHYRRLGGRLEIVKETIQRLFESGVHTEVTTLIVTGFNDRAEELEAAFQWLSSVSKDIPYHLSRYFPAYQAKKKATDTDFMKEMWKLSSRYLNYVYLGNMSGASNTVCPNCGHVLVERDIYQTEVTGIRIKNGKTICANCGSSVPFVMDSVL